MPHKVDSFSANTPSELLKGFDITIIDGSDLLDKLTDLSPCDMDTHKTRIDEVISSQPKGKDKSKLRITVRLRR